MDGNSLLVANKGNDRAQVLLLEDGSHLRSIGHVRRWRRCVHMYEAHWNGTKGSGQRAAPVRLLGGYVIKFSMTQSPEYVTDLLRNVLRAFIFVSHFSKNGETAKLQRFVKLSGRGHQKCRKNHTLSFTFHGFDEQL